MTEIDDLALIAFDLQRPTLEALKAYVAEKDINPCVIELVKDLLAVQNLAIQASYGQKLQPDFFNILIARIRANTQELKIPKNSFR